jgi:hypothetical protein
MEFVDARRANDHTDNQFTVSAGDDITESLSSKQFGYDFDLNVL